MPLTARRIFQTWWPLAFSWLLMGFELPAVSAVMARLAQPEISLAAYGGVVFPIALIIEAPVIMLLAASTALCKDWASYLVVRRYMRGAAVALTLLHLLIAFTPLFDLVVGGIIGAPEAIHPASRLGLQIMTPWTGAIAYRRFQQGILIRFGRSRAVGLGTVVRLLAAASVLVFGGLYWDVPGIVVGTTAIALGVTAEAFAAGFWVRPVLRGPLREAAPIRPVLTFRAFLSFYVPLALTSLIGLIGLPMGSAGMSRMPRALDSLATWPVVNGFTFLFRGVGMAYNEVVVATLDHPGAISALRRFAIRAAVVGSALYLFVCATPLMEIWLGTVSALPERLVQLGRSAAWIFLLMPAHGFFQSLYQGILVDARKTRAITEAIVAYLSVSALVLVVGIAWGRGDGLYFGLGGVFLGAMAQLGWLRFRVARVLRGRIAAEAGAQRPDPAECPDPEDVGKH